MKGELLAGVLLLMLVFFSGCTLPGQTTQTTTVAGQGLTIEDFGAGHNYVYGGDTTETIEVKVRNNGDQDIQTVTATPYLLAWPNYSGDKTCATALLKPNAELNRLGSPCTMKWTVTVPSVTKQETFKAGVRVKYLYTTTTTAKVYALTSGMYAGLMERGTDVRSIQDQVYGSGPIQVDVLVDNVLIYGSGNNQLPVTIKFTNIGQGYPAGTGDRDFSITSVSVDASSAVTQISADTTQCNNVRMRQGLTGDCVMTLNVGSYSGQELEVPIKVTAHYTYVAEQETSIVVNPSLTR